ncbi:type 2 lanthipeptide synthetase LanM family protein [Actinokineospora auranticolor]|uniref:type 2 lanthipeptide synthetase LanM family protein n=1 Tax=Actinokineospora auranticolor TaxID=155976 RepID=UPI001C6822EC|nr:type 2 lanthipeptide synthetase LanM family protein [Actinokineospora auranticolor]
MTGHVDHTADHTDLRVEFPDPHWWVPGLAPHERADAPEPAVPGQRIAAGTARAASRALPLRTDPPARPSWVDTVERAVTAPRTGRAVSGADWRVDFAAVLWPLVADARDRVRAATGHLDADLVAMPAVLDGFADRLGHELAGLAARSLVERLRRAADSGDLPGGDSRARYRSFLAAAAAPAALVALCAELPVLARLLGQAADHAVTACRELLDHLAADRAELTATLLDGADPGPVVAVDGRRGDPHRRGRSVAVLTFADGRRLVYQPRDSRAHVRFGEFVALLDRRVPGLGLTSVGVLARGDHGWLEHVAPAPLADRAAADVFYRRQGALLALLHVLHAADIHFENVIARADQPLLVDVETLLHPSLPGPAAAGDPAAAALADSVHQTSMLPVIVVGDHGAADISGLGGDPGAPAPDAVTGWADPGTDRMRPTRVPGRFPDAANRPRLGDAQLDPGDHEPALLEGFHAAHDAIVAHRGEFAALVRASADLEVRVVVRASNGYASLLAESTHPDLLRDARDRDRAFDVLRHAAAGDPLRARLAPHEIADLWAGDVPVFTARPGGTDLWTTTGHRIPGALGRSGVDRALATVAATGAASAGDQAWIISATLATRRPPGDHRGGTPGPDLPAGRAADPERLLAAACALGDQVVARGIEGAGRVNWLGVELVDDRQWLVLPLGAGLATGYTGVALFLAQLAERTGIDRYGEVARRALAPLPALFDAVAARPDLLPVIGCGGWHGFGGIAYALARAGVLLDDADLRRWAAHAAELAAAAAALPGPLGWSDGLAGCATALRAVHTDTGDPTAARAAADCATALATGVTDALRAAVGPESLESEVDSARAGYTSTPPGFADGAAGIGWALARTGDAAAARVAADLLRRAGSGPGVGWCSGAAGLAAARTALLDHDDPACHTRATRAAARRLVTRPVLRDLSLCHGELGVAEALATLAPHCADPAVAGAARARAGLVLAAIDRGGPHCGTPGGLPTPGLLNGVAGIGYGLLRLAQRDRVPSVLLLQPGG